MTGIRAEVEIGSPGDCPVAATSRKTDADINSVSWTSSPGEEDDVIEEFTAESDSVPETPDVDDVFGHDSFHIFQFSRDNRNCVCETVEQLIDRPISDIHARDGKLYVTFHTSNLDDIKDTVATLRENFADIHVHQLTRSGVAQQTDVVLVDRGMLTARQREVLQTAHRMGYFSHPKDANAGEVADELGIASSTFSEHLAAAQSKMTEALLD